MKFRFIFFLSGISFLSMNISAQLDIDTLIHLPGSIVYGNSLPVLSNASKSLFLKENPVLLDGTVSEAFKQIPSLVTDIEGGITYRGSSQSTLLMNGIPYGLLEEYNGDFLIQLPARFFQQVSVSSFPPVEWITDGHAGIVNLSSLSSGDSPLTFNLGAGWKERYNAGLIWDQPINKLHFTVKYNYRKEFRQRTFHKITKDANGTTEMNNNAEARPDIHLADLRVRYNISSSDKVYIYGLYSYMDYDRYGKINNRKLDKDGNVQNHIYRHRNNVQKQHAAAVEAHWLHQFTRPEDYWEVVFNYNNFGYEEENRYQNELVSNGNIVKEDNLFIDHIKHNYYTSFVYHKSFNRGWLWKSGYTGHFKDEKYKAAGYDKTNDEWVVNTVNSNEYDFIRQTHLLFTSFMKEWEKWSIEPDIQIEYQRQKIQFVRNNQFRIYPRLRLNYVPAQEHMVSLRYQQHSFRAIGSWLNSFLDQSDNSHITRGNPDLKDELIHSLELSYTYNIEDLQIVPAFYFRSRTNRIMEVAYQEKQKTVWVKENIGDAQTMGMELSVYWKPLRFLSWNVSGNVYRDEIDGRIIGYKEKKSLLCNDLKTSFQFFATPNTEFQIDGFYISDQLTPQGKIKSHYTINAGLSQYFMNRKLRANVSIQNIFDSLEEVTLIDMDSLQVRQERNRDPQMIWLSLSYSW